VQKYLKYKIDNRNDSAYRPWETLAVSGQMNWDKIDKRPAENLRKATNIRIFQQKPGAKLVFYLGVIYNYQNKSNRAFVKFRYGI